MLVERSRNPRFPDFAMRYLVFLYLLGVMLISEAKAREPKSFIYKTVDEVEIEADVYVTEGEASRPVILWIHGGALMLGSRKNIPPQVVEMSKEENYTLVSIDYRLAPETDLFGIVEDLGDAIRWIRDKGPGLFQADPERLVVIGASAGGYLALMSARLPGIKPPDAIVSCWGYGDILADWCTKPNPKFGGKKPGPTREQAYAGIGKQALTATGKEDYASRSVLFHYMKRNGLWTEIVSRLNVAEAREKLVPYCPERNVTKNDPPLLMLHGTADPDVPVSQSRAMHAAVQKVGAISELVIVEGGGHGLWGGDKKKIEAAFDRSLEFMREHLNR